MQQFVVPQFIDVEDKIFGPITTRQFLILLAAGIIIFLAYRFADFTLFAVTAVLVGGIAVLFSFVRVNGQNFHYFLLNVGQSIRRPSLRIWNKKFSAEELNYWRKEKIEEVAQKEIVKQPSGTRIRDLALSVNTGGFYRPEEE